MLYNKMPKHNCYEVDEFAYGKLNTIVYVDTIEEAEHYIHNCKLTNKEEHLTGFTYKIYVIG